MLNFKLSLQRESVIAMTKSSVSLTWETTHCSLRASSPFEPERWKVHALETRGRIRRSLARSRAACLAIEAGAGGGEVVDIRTGNLK